METKVNCLPVYIMIDTSASMAPYEDVLNETIETLYDSRSPAHGFPSSSMCRF